MPKAVRKSSNKRPAGEPAIIVFGVDNLGKPRAGWFGKDEVEPASKAAEANGFAIMKIGGEADPKLLSKIRFGKTYATSDGLVPIVGKNLFAQIEAAAGVVNADISYRGIPRTFEEIEPGHLVIVQESPKDGWYEAIVVQREGDRFRVRWRDYPRLPAFVRPLTSIALPCPAQAAV